MSLQEYLPSKQFIKIAGGLLAIGLIVFGIIYLTSEKSPLKNLIPETPTETYTDLVSKDTDGDGVFDWEESLWQTDITKADGDGDGVSDKDYIEAKKSILNTKESNGELKENLTETEKFAREFFSTFMSLYQSGKRSNQTTAQIVEAANQAIAQRVIADKYTISEVQEVLDSPENKEIYTQKIAQILVYVTDRTGDEIQLIDDILNTPGSTNAKTIQNQAKLYEQASIDMMKLSVPSLVSARHLALANTYNKIAVASIDMSLIAEDPFRAVGGMKIFIDNQKTLLDLLTILEPYLLSD